MSASWRRFLACCAVGAVAGTATGKAIGPVPEPRDTSTLTVAPQIHHTRAAPTPLGDYRFLCLLDLAAFHAGRPWHSDVDAPGPLSAPVGECR